MKPSSDTLSETMTLPMAMLLCVDSRIGPDGAPGSTCRRGERPGLIGVGAGRAACDGRPGRNDGRPDADGGQAGADGDDCGDTDGDDDRGDTGGEGDDVDVSRV